MCVCVCVQGEELHVATPKPLRPEPPRSAPTLEPSRIQAPCRLASPKRWFLCVPLDDSVQDASEREKESQRATESARVSERERARA
jgi:hypothetical protein